MFEKWSKKSESLKITPVMKKTLISAGLLDDIWRLTILPKDEFLLTYGAFFEACSDLLLNAKASGIAVGEGDFNATLADIARIMKIKKGLLFPRGIDADDAVRMTEALSFAVATALGVESVISLLGKSSAVSGSSVWVPFCDVDPLANAVIEPREQKKGVEMIYAAKLINDEGFKWLYQYSPVFNNWVNYFTEPEQSEVFKLVSIANGRDVKTDRIIVKKTDAIKSKNIEEDEPKNQQDKLKKSKGQVFIDWLIMSINRMELSINESDSLVHITGSNGLFIASPGIFEEYEEETGFSAKTVKNQFQRMRINRLMENGNNLYMGTISGLKVSGLIVEDIVQELNCPNEKSTELKLKV